MDDLQKVLMDQARLNGAVSVGVATLETLDGGPVSADLTRVLEGARSAITFAVRLDPEAIGAFLSKRDRLAHERDNIDVNTTAGFEPTAPLPPEENYCDGCRLCMGSCLSGLMEKDAKASVTLGGMEFTYSKRRSYLRCEYVCGGFTGLHPSGSWSTWSPGRFPVPSKDEEFLPVLMKALANYSRWPQMAEGYYHVLSPHKMYLTCGNCQLVCHPDPDERKARYRLLTEGGVVIQNSDGSLEAVSPDEARRRMKALKPDRRALYESA